MACHEDDIPDVGDYLVYELAHLSYLVVRVAEDEFKAYHNACLHRGRLLRQEDGKKARDLRCAFHGWTWNLDGSLKEIPCQWDFPYVNPDEQSLPEVKAARWGGFVFINPDPDAEPFEEFVGDLESHFTLLPYEKRYKEAHVAKVLRCNWKVAQEAFMEAYHVVATHPQILAGICDANSKYDVFGNIRAGDHAERRAQPAPLERAAGGAAARHEPLQDAPPTHGRHLRHAGRQHRAGDRTGRSHRSLHRRWHVDQRRAGRSRPAHVPVAGGAASSRPTTRPGAAVAEATTASARRSPKRRRSRVAATSWTSAWSR